MSFNRSAYRSVEILLLILFIHSFAATAFGNDAILFSELHSRQKVQNCGVNVSCFALSFFKKEINYSELERQLGVGKSWERPSDLLRIKSTLEYSGLLVDGFEKATLTEVGGKLMGISNGLAILHLQGDAGTAGHFVLLFKRTQDTFLVVDVGNEPEPLSIDKLQTSLRDKFTGVFLIVSEKEGMATRKFELDGKDIVIEVGEISGTGILEIPVLIINTQAKEIQFKNAKGTCSCFLGATVDGDSGKSILSHEARKLIFSFNKERLEVGNVSREILVNFEGLNQGSVKFIFRGHVTAIPPTLKTTWAPESINLGIVRSFSDSPSQTITILTPPGITIGVPESTLTSSVIIEKRLGDLAEIEERGRTVHRISVDVSRYNKNKMYETITIPTNDPSVKIVIPITGERRTAQ